MPRRQCSICARPDADVLLNMVKNGLSARQVALRSGLHVRVFSEHLRRHTGHPAAARRRGRLSSKLQAERMKTFTVAAEAQALLTKVSSVLDAAELAKSHSLTLQAVREAKGLLDLIGRANGELSSPGAVNIQLGVSVEQAKNAVEQVEHAQSLPPQALADRAVAFLERYNHLFPQDRRTVLSLPEATEGDDPTPVEG